MSTLKRIERCLKNEVATYPLLDCRNSDRNYRRSTSCISDRFWRRTCCGIYKTENSISRLQKSSVGNSAVTGKKNSGSHFPYSEESKTSLRRGFVPASIDAIVCVQVGASNQVKTGRIFTGGSSLIPVPTCFPVNLLIN